MVGKCALCTCLPPSESAWNQAILGLGESLTLSGLRGREKFGLRIAELSENRGMFELSRSFAQPHRILNSEAFARGLGAKGDYD
jgi:hypothetical protein